MLLMICIKGLSKTRANMKVQILKIQMNILPIMSFSYPRKHAGNSFKIMLSNQRLVNILMTLWMPSSALTRHSKAYCPKFMLILS